VREKVKFFVRGKRGVRLVEYIIIIGIVLAVALVGGGMIGSKTKKVSDNLGTDIGALQINTTNTATGTVTEPTHGEFTVNGITIQ